MSTANQILDEFVLSEMFSGDRVMPWWFECWVLYEHQQRQLTEEELEELDGLLFPTPDGIGSRWAVSE